MAREWMDLPQDEKMWYDVIVWVRATTDKELYSSSFELVCFPDELDEKIEELAEEEYRSEFIEVAEWEIRERKRLVNAD